MCEGTRLQASLRGFEICNIVKYTIGDVVVDFLNIVTTCN